MSIVLLRTENFRALAFVGFLHVITTPVSLEMQLPFYVLKTLPLIFIIHIK